MATIAEIAVNITARTQKLEAGLKRSSQKMNTMGKSAQKSGGGLKAFAMKAAGALAVVAGLAKIMSGIAGQFTRIDEAAKGGRALGMTTQQMMQLQHSAELAGVSTSGLTNGLKRMVVSVQDAGRGTGEAAKVMKDLGINVEALKTQTPHQQFLTMANAIKRIQDPAVRADAAMKIFGKSGADLINMLAGGSAALEDQAKKFDDLHGVISEQDAASIEETNDAVADMKKAWGGFWTQIATLLAPAIRGLAKLLGGLAKVLRTVSGAVKKVGGFFKKLFGITEKQKPAIEATTDAIDMQTESLDAVATAAEEAAKKQDDLIKAGVAVTEQFKNPMEKFQDRMKHLDELVRAGAISWETYSRAVQGAIQDQKKANQRQIQAAKPISAVTMGSSAGFSAIQQANREQDKQTKIAEQELALARQRNAILAGVRRDIQQDPEPEVANI